MDEPSAGCCRRMLFRACLVLASILPLASQAPQGRMAFKTYGSAQGLGTSTNWDLVQDRSGFMWVGSVVGLFRFDGNQFKLFGLKDGLPSHFIGCLQEGPDGTLWVGTYRGLARRRQDRFESVPLGPDGNPPEVSRIAPGPQGRMWVATSSGVFAQDAEGRFQPVPGWPGGQATALWAQPDAGRVWVAAWQDSRARILAWEDGIWTRYAAGGELAVTRIDALAVDGDRRVWARSQKTLWQLDHPFGQFHPVEPALPPAPQRGYLHVDRGGNLWVTTLKGIARFGRDGLSWITPAEGLPEVNLTTVTEDQEGTLWVAGAGLYHLQGHGAWRSYPRSTGMPPGPVWCILRDREGRLYTGTDQGLYQGGPRGWSVVRGTEGTQVRSAVQAPDGAIYMAGSPEVVRWNPAGGPIVHFGPGDGVEPGGRIYRLLLDREGALWVATERGGLLKGTPRGGRMVFHRAEVPRGDPQENFNDLRQDAAGRLWAAGNRGLLVREGAAWHRYTTADGLRDDHVSYLHPMANGDLAFAYFEPLGLAMARLGPTGFRILNHLDDKFPSEKVVYLMGEDAQGSFWVGTGQGLDRMARNGEVEHFGVGDGLFCEDTNSMAFLADPGGDVWVGTNFGLAHFVATLDPGMPLPPRCALLTCRLGSTPIPLIAGTQPRTSSRSRTFEAEFSALTYVKEEDVHYQTRLLGLEAGWHDTGVREARYPMLPPGSYLFEVRARAGLGAWGPAASIPFRVLPAWWQTWWFRASGILALGGLVALYSWLRIAALHRRNRALRDMVERRTRELAIANEQLKNQSLTDPLTGLRNRRFLGLSMPDDVARVNRIHSTARRLGAARTLVNVDMIFIMIDLDHFKVVNDAHGHAAGDQVLQEVTHILRGATRDTDTLVRWGGEEFLVVARNACREDAPLLVDRILKQVAEKEFVLPDGTRLRCTCSLGYTVYPFLAESPGLLTWEHLLDLADHCLYAAKRSGRNAWVGLCPAGAPDPEIIREGLPFRIEELIREGRLEVSTSFPKDVALVWQGNP